MVMYSNWRLQMSAGLFSFPSENIYVGCVVNSLNVHGLWG